MLKKKVNKSITEDIKISTSKILFQCKCGTSISIDTIYGIFSGTVHVTICLMCHYIRTQKKNIIDDACKMIVIKIIDCFS